MSEYKDRSQCEQNHETTVIDNQLVMNLRNLGHIIRFLYEGKGSQKRILIILNESGGMTQRELTEKLGVRPGSASEVIGKLESAGLIQRTPSASDRRTADIHLTKEGLKRANDADIQRKKRHREMFSCLTDDEKKTLLRLTEKINNDWSTRYCENYKELEHRERHNHRKHK